MTNLIEQAKSQMEELINAGKKVALFVGEEGKEKYTFLWPDSYEIQKIFPGELTKAEINQRVKEHNLDSAAFLTVRDLQKSK